MQEFSSISVSSYEPGTLADRLNEQAADGWALVTVVPTGATVTAYLSRERTGAAAQSAPSPVADVTPAPAAAAASSVEQAAPSEPDTSVAIEGGNGPGMGASQAATEPVSEPVNQPVDEPGG